MAKPVPPQGETGPCVPRQETPGAAFQRSRLLLGLFSCGPSVLRCVCSSSDSENISQTALLRQPLCSATPPAQQPLG